MKMSEEQKLIVLQKTKDLWNLKAKREGREVRYTHTSISVRYKGSGDGS